MTSGAAGSPASLLHRYPQGMIMNPKYLLSACAVGTMALTSHAYAHGFAGDHMFISTLLIDDPIIVADEASLPTFSFCRIGRRRWNVLQRPVRARLRVGQAHYGEVWLCH